MPLIPAICEGCGRAVHSGMELDGGSARITGSATVCPHCGAIARIVDANYIPASDIHLIVEGARNEELAKLRDLLQSAANDERLNVSALADIIEREFPRQSKLASLLRDRRNRMEALAILGVIGTFLNLLVLRSSPDDGAVDQLFDTATQQYFEQLESDARPHSETSEMKEFTGRKFSDEVVSLDGARFVRCEFRRCQVDFSGAQSTELDSCIFIECNWTFSGPASATMGFLRAVYHGVRGAGPKLVERTFEAIRTPPDDSAPTVSND